MPVAAGVNEAGLKAVVAFLAAFPERWDQMIQFGRRPGMASYCFASLTCWLAGENIDELLEVDRRAGSPLGTTVYQIAAWLLGLTATEATWIFRYQTTEAGYHPTPEEFCRRITAVTGVELDAGWIAAETGR